MRLTKLEIYGFKSFARRTEIVFPQNVTGIVGPNGSGKSNIADAVRWVLGEQSAKTLRGNNMSDVIFNGTETKKPMNYCEVTLVFDNTDHQLNMEFTEVSITRRVYRSGDSEYILNGSTCRLKDIVDLFRDTGVGKEGYSIIGQGRIDEILSLRGEDRRAVFEEAAGISRFRTRKEDAETHLKHAEENLTRVLDVLEELRTHLVPLKKQADAAKEFLSLSDSLKELDVRLFLTRYIRLKNRECTAESTLTQIADSLREAELRLTEAVERRESGEREQEEIQAALGAAHDTLLKESDALHVQKESAAAIDNRIKNNEETLARLQTETDSYDARLRLIELTVNQSQRGMEEAETLLIKAREALEQRKAEHGKAAERAQTLEDELSAHKNALLKRMSQAQNVRTVHATQSAMQQQMKERRAEVETKYASEQARHDGLLSALTQAQENLADEQARMQTLEGEAEAFEKSTRQLLTDILAAQKQLQEDTQTARAMDTRLKTLRELQDGYEGYQYPVKNALSYAKRQHMSGVHDVLAMLIHVPREYETALDMALGPAMQNIVTETEEDGKRLIDYLRQNRLGRATFLPISAMHGRTLTQHERGVLSMDGCLGVASELCGFDPQYRGIIEYMLGRTVVARDLQCGIQIMRAGGRAFRLVTLDGDVMNPGGSMTGGSIQQKAQNLLGREREIKELEASVKELNQRILESQEALTRMETLRADEKERRESAQYELHQQEIAVVRDTERLKTAQTDMDAHQALLESYEGAFAQLDESLSQIALELKQIEAQRSEEAENAEEQNARTEELSACLDKARRERETAQDALTDAMLTLQNAEHDCDRLQRDRSRLQTDGESCRSELAKLAQKRTRTEQDSAAAREDKMAAVEAVELCEAHIEAAREHLAQTERLRDDKQRALRDLQTEIDATQQLAAQETERLHRQEMTLSRFRAEIGQLTDRLWDTYELSYAGAEEAKAVYDARSDNSAELDEQETDQKAREIRERIRLMGAINVGAIEDYAQMRARHDELEAQKNDIERAKMDLQALIAQLLDQMETVFVGQFSAIRRYFSETFSRLFGGGCGDISLNNPSDPLNCGIDIFVQPPGKKRQILSLFSGGERALTAIAILFAMLKLKPTPFCILDEIEAALDDANIGYFADYLKEFSRDTQFIVVTHRKGTMERCDTLFGVAMEERGVSSMVSVNLMDYEE